MRHRRLIFTCFLAGFMLAGGARQSAKASPVAAPVYAFSSVMDSVKTIQILFTNDIHSSADYLSLAALTERERERAGRNGIPTLLLDAGDIAMGTVFHTLYAREAFEYNVMSLMGYDAVTSGNHDFDFGVSAFLKMLSSLKKSDSLSTSGTLNGSNTSFLVSNLAFLSEKENLILKKLTAPYKIVGRGGIKSAVIGVMGENSFSCVSRSDSLLFFPAIPVVDSLVKEIGRCEDVDFTIVISHGGTMGKNPSKSEDALLAAKVPGIDLIISGHDHDLLHAPIMIGHTPVVTSGAMGDYLGKIVLQKRDGEPYCRVVEYELIPAKNCPDGNIGIKNYIDSSKSVVEGLFRERHGIGIYDTVAFIHEVLDLPVRIGGKFYSSAAAGDSVEVSSGLTSSLQVRKNRQVDENELNNLPLGQLVAQSYKFAAEQLDESSEQFIAIAPFGVIRKNLESGYVTYADIFNILSLGSTPEGGFGYPLVTAYLTGEELKDLCELNASVAASMADARLYFAGLSYEYNPCRIPFTRVTRLFQEEKDYSTAEAAEDGMGERSRCEVNGEMLYGVVTDLYTAELIGLLESSSFGLLGATAKNAAGEKIDSFDTSILPVTQWQALAMYIKKRDAEFSFAPLAIERRNCSVYLLYAFYLMAAISIFLLVWQRLSGRR